MKSLKISVVGDTGVGKSSIVIQLAQNHFALNHDPTLEQFYRREISVDGTTATLDILDSVHGEEDKVMRDSYMLAHHGYVLVYSVASKVSFDKIPQIRERICNRADSDRVPMVLVANKSDLDAVREVPTDDGRDLAISWGIPFVEASALTRVGFDEIFPAIVRLIIAKQTTSESHPSSGNTTNFKCSIS